MIRSPTLVWLILNVTLMLLIVAPAGIPATPIVFEAPATLLSGTGIEILPVAKVDTAPLVAVKV